MQSPFKIIILLVLLGSFCPPLLAGVLHKSHQTELAIPSTQNLLSTRSDSSDIKKAKKHATLGFLSSLGSLGLIFSGFAMAEAPMILLTLAGLGGLALAFLGFKFVSSASRLIRKIRKGKLQTKKEDRQLQRAKIRAWWGKFFGVISVLLGTMLTLLSLVNSV